MQVYELILELMQYKQNQRVLFAGEDEAISYDSALLFEGGGIGENPDFLMIMPLFEAERKKT